MAKENVVRRQASEAMTNMEKEKKRRSETKTRRRGYAIAWCEEYGVLQKEREKRRGQCTNILIEINNDFIQKKKNRERERKKVESSSISLSLFSLVLFRTQSILLLNIKKQTSRE